MKYRKKPVEIEALEWTGQNHRQMFNFLYDGENPDQRSLQTIGKNFYISHGENVGGLTIKTSEGDMIAKIGDYIIKEPFDKDRQFYPCKPDIFALTYDKI